MAGDGTVTPANFGSQLLSRMGLPTSGGWVNVANAWVAAESGSPNSGSSGWRYNNPLNTQCYDWDTQKTGCWTTKSGSRFAIYPNLDAAITAYTSHGWLGNPGYVGIRNAKTPTALANAISGSPWDAGHYKQYHYGGLTGIAALVAERGLPIQGPPNPNSTQTGGASASSGDTGGGVSLPPVSTGNPISDFVANWVMGLLTGKSNNGLPSAQDIMINVGAFMVGFVMVIVGLIMFLRGTNSPGEAIRGAGKAGFDFGVSMAVPAYAGRAGGARALGAKSGNLWRARNVKPEPDTGEVPVEEAIGVKGKPAGSKARERHGFGSGADIKVNRNPRPSYSSETPRNKNRGLQTIPEIRRKEPPRKPKNVTPRRERWKLEQEGFKVE